MIEGASQAFFGQVGTAIDPVALFGDPSAPMAGVFSFGATLALVHSQWHAIVDNETITELAHTIEESSGSPPDYTDELIETEDYRATADFRLADQRVTGTFGVRVKPADQVELALTWMPGMRVAHTGPVGLEFGCPPQSDTLGRFGAESLGLCYAELEGTGIVAFDYPSRVHGGLVVRPTAEVRLEGMFGYVTWSDYTDFELTIGDVDAEPETAETVAKKRLRARANVDSYWVGLDGKAELTDTLLAGARVTFDRAAVPDEALSPNNYDANDVILMGLFAFKPVPTLQFGASYSHHILQTRTITNSGFGVTLGEDQKEDRWFWGSANGQYAASIERVGVSVRGHFGGE